jgi:cytidylate kinase
MDGRDIGTDVFPDAELKIFMTADPDIRAKRRFDELEAKKIPASLADVKANLLARDHEDMTRKESPLRKALDAITLDNTHLSREQQLDFVYDLAIGLIHKKKNAVAG